MTGAARPTTTYLVTGGAGFIGSHLVRTILARGDAVRVLDNFATGRRDNLEGLEGPVRLIEGDLRDPDAVREAVEGVDYVLHQAALSSVPRSLEDPAATTEVNVVGTAVLLEQSRRAGVRCLVAASSSAVYGELPDEIKVETLPCEPISPYGASKLAAEEYYRTYARSLGLPTVALRYFNVFGPRQDPDSAYAAVLPRFMKAWSEGRPPTIYGDGEQSRDFTYIDNVVAANLLACESEAARGRAINVACGGSIRVNELASMVREAMGSGIEVEHVGERAGDIRHSRADIGPARQTLGYEPTVGFREGIERTVAWFLGQDAGSVRPSRQGSQGGQP